MFGVIGAHAASHLLRRSVHGQPREEYIQQLQAQSKAYEESFQSVGPSSEVHMYELIGMLVTAVVFLVIFVSVRYSLGEVVSSLAMVEQPRTIILEEVKMDDGEPDAPISEKERLIDEEVSVFKEQPITSSIRKTMCHLYRIGGRQSRWRGVGAGIVYHFVHTLTGSFLAGLVGGNMLVRPFMFILASLLTARIHMTWTHCMISHPSEKPWYRRIPQGRKAWKALVLPSFVFAAAQQLTCILPAFVFFFQMDIFFQGLEPQEALDKTDSHKVAVAVTSAAATALFTAVFILLPASVTLTRVEASLLPEDQETIVPFDRTLNGTATAAMTLGGSAGLGSMFVEAWRSFDRASRARLVRFYMKMFFILITVAALGVFALSTEVALIGPEKLKTFVIAVHAQLRLAAMGVE